MPLADRRALAALAVALVACDSREVTPDAGFERDGGVIELPGDPPPPVLGAQLDRAGRPAIRELLIGTLADGADQAALWDAYDRAADPASWATTLLATNHTLQRELADNLAVFDGIDLGSPTIPSPRCANTLVYDASAGGGPSLASYLPAAALLADDQLYVDTAKTTCTVYLAVELDRATGHQLPHTTCGGRTPAYDVIDMLYSVLAAGGSGVNSANLRPWLDDGIDAHGDIKDTFPFLGPPR